MNHPTLGLLESKGLDSDSFEGEVEIVGNRIDLNIELDTASQDQAFVFAENVVTAIFSLKEKARISVASATH